ncbi:MAG TPA: hypothetical protein VL202_00365 [Pararhizobium sp.]|uniref:hypothetical protein n=1 Tax=Pararhizobium sp. TaxID=1977563 RepID=UPI002C1E212A|nr:hypothetical protein [Pararhizobium sp.]HTO29623.1 hypothetical protein [Pararhizobium sp.]
MDTRSPIPSAPPSRDRGANPALPAHPALAEVTTIVDAALVRAHRVGSVIGALVASGVYIIVEIARALS